ncbi:unnamed protein product [Musa textilis]
MELTAADLAATEPKDAREKSRAREDEGSDMDPNFLGISKLSQSVPDVGFKYGANQDGVASAGSLQDRLLVCQGERRRLQGLTSKAPPSPPSPTSGFQDPRDERVNDASRGIGYSCAMTNVANSKSRIMTACGRIYRKQKLKPVRSLFSTIRR